MPECLRDDDCIRAILEQGTLRRDFALSMQALGFGDEPLTYKQARLRPDSHKCAEAEDIECMGGHPELWHFQMDNIQRNV